jgi:hypothetical protein
MKAVYQYCSEKHLHRYLPWKALRASVSRTGQLGSKSLRVKARQFVRWRKKQKGKPLKPM